LYPSHHVPILIIVNYNTIFVQHQIHSAVISQCEPICTNRTQYVDRNDCDKHLNLHGSQIPSAVVRQCEPICTKRRQSETQNDFDENTHRHKIPTFDDNERTTCQTIRDMAEKNVPRIDVTTFTLNSHRSTKMHHLNTNDMKSYPTKPNP